MLALPDIRGPVHTPQWAIEGVPAGHAAVPWRRCWQLLRRAAERFATRERWSSDGLLYEVTAGNAQLWIAWSYERRRIEGAVITRVFDRPDMAPNDRVCECPLVGGEGMAAWGAPMFALIRTWALAQGCTYIAGYGRRGWKRLFGFSEMGVTPDGLPILILRLRRD